MGADQGRLPTQPFATGSAKVGNPYPQQSFYVCGRAVGYGSRVAVVARLMVRPVCSQLRKCRVRPARLVPRAAVVARLTLGPQLRKCCVAPGTYAWCQLQTFAGCLATGCHSDHLKGGNEDWGDRRQSAARVPRYAHRRKSRYLAGLRGGTAAPKIRQKLVKNVLTRRIASIGY
jgi:hypothetical protein